jgi:hypothetical protein
MDETGFPGWLALVESWHVGLRFAQPNQPCWMWSDAANVVRAGLAAIEHGQVVCVPGRMNRAIKVLMDLLPDRLALALVARRAKDFRVHG